MKFRGDVLVSSLRRSFVKTRACVHGYHSDLSNQAKSLNVNTLINPIQTGGEAFGTNKN